MQDGHPNAAGWMNDNKDKWPARMMALYYMSHEQLLVFQATFFHPHSRSRTVSQHHAGFTNMNMLGLLSLLFVEGLRCHHHLTHHVASVPWICAWNLLRFAVRIRPRRPAWQSSALDPAIADSQDLCSAAWWLAILELQELPQRPQKGGTRATRELGMSGSGHWKLVWVVFRRRPFRSTNLLVAQEA